MVSASDSSREIPPLEPHEREVDLADFWLAHGRQMLRPRDARFPAKWIIDGAGLRFIERRASMLWGL